jgi:hypothetical protein
MNVAPMMLVALVGFMCGPIAVAALARWIGFLYLAWVQARSTPDRVAKRRAVILALCQSLFHAGPWSVAVAVFFAYQISSEPWAPWFFAGFGAGFLLMGVATVKLALKLRSSQRARADANAV